MHKVNGKIYFWCFLIILVAQKSIWTSTIENIHVYIMCVV